MIVTNTSPYLYLDNAATTQPEPEVVQAMLPWLTDKFGNAASIYYPRGEAARNAIETAREQLAELIHVDKPRRLYFTSGATESIVWSLQGTVLATGKKHIIVSAVEHHAVIETAKALEKRLDCKVDIIPVTSTGEVELDALKQAITPDTAIVAIMHANNEVGTINPIVEIAEICKSNKVTFMVDACQTVGKIPVDVQELGADLLCLSAHKFHGPQGVGALYIRPGVKIDPLFYGGSQEDSRRSGTHNVPGIVGMGKAAAMANTFIADGARQYKLVEELWQKLDATVPALSRNGDPKKRIPGILNLCARGVEGEAILLDLRFHNIDVSSGSACTTGDLSPSHVLMAMGVPLELAHGSMRISMSHKTPDNIVDIFVPVFEQSLLRLREFSLAWP